jgi:hypothetical protein
MMMNLLNLVTERHFNTDTLVNTYERIISKITVHYLKRKYINWIRFNNFEYL